MTAAPWLGLYHSVPPSIEPKARTGLEMFRHTVAAHRDAALVHYFDRSSTAGQLDAWSDALAVALQERGAEPGDRHRLPEHPAGVCRRARCLEVWRRHRPMQSDARERELTKILADSGSRILISQEDLCADVAARCRQRRCSTQSPRHHSICSTLDTNPARPVGDAAASSRRSRRPLRAGKRTRRTGAQPVDITGDDVAFMVYTSRTTGEPKAAMNTHRNVVFATSVYERWIGLTPQDAILGLAPHRPHRARHAGDVDGRVSLFYRFDVDEACRLTQLHRATSRSAVTAFRSAHEARRWASTTSHRSRRLPPAARRPTWSPGRLARKDRHTHLSDIGLTEATSPTHMTAAQPSRWIRGQGDVGRSAGVRYRRPDPHRRWP